MKNKSIIFFVVSYINFILFVFLMFIYVKPNNKQNPPKRDSQEIFENVIEYPIIMRYAIDEVEESDKDLNPLYAAVENDLIEAEKRLKK